MAIVRRTRNQLSGALKRRRRSTTNTTVALLAVTLFTLLLGVLYVRSADRALAVPPARNDKNVETIAKGTVRGVGTSAKGTEAFRQKKERSFYDGEASGGDEEASRRDIAVIAEKQEEVTVQTDADNSVALDTPHGQIRIRFRPDLSPESVAYIREIVTSIEECNPCNLYRAEKPGILQGKIVKKGIKPNKVLGKCPAEYLATDGKPPARQCPPHDPNCGCHGPVMERGMVAWAGGGGGPDFFFDMYKRPAKWWGNDHTVWGEVADSKSLAVVDSIFELPATKKGSMTFLDEPIHFKIIAQ